MPSIKTKYGTVINTTGLLPEQIAKVRQIAEGNGAYGSKGAALADSFRKKNARPAAAEPPPVNEQPVTDPNAGIDPKTGAVNPEDLFGAARANWNDDQAKAMREKGQQAAYDFTTKNYAADKARELEDAKQEAANRGLPYDPANPDSGYGRLVGSVDRKYTQLDQDAKNQAILQGNQLYQTETQANTNSFDSFINAALGMSQADLAKYGIDQNMISQAKQLKAQKEAARAARGGGGGGGDNTSDIII